MLVFDRSGIFVNCSVLSGYGRNSLDNELDMELDDDEEELDGFTEDRLDSRAVIFCIDHSQCLIKCVTVNYLVNFRIKIVISFSHLIAGSPELCACENLQVSTFWPKHVKAFFFWPHIYSDSDFFASSKAIFIPFLTHILSRLLCWH